MGRYFRISSEAQADVIDISADRAEFDKGAGIRFGRAIIEMGESLIEFPERFLFIREERSLAMHRVVVESCNVFYVVCDEYVEIVRVFGPGRDWQSQL